MAGKATSHAVTCKAKAIAAAQVVARQYGVACDEAVPLSGGSNVLVHLKPSPVVARVMTGTSMLHDDTERWLAREVAVAVFLAGRTGSVVPPSDLLPPGPHERDGLWMTMWKFVGHDPRAPLPDAGELGRSLRELHVALAGFQGDLSPVSEIRDWLGSLLAQLRPSPWVTGPDIDWLRLKLDTLTSVVFESALPTQALHGDVAVSNLLHTESGLVWNDLEDVCVGPVAWDVAGLVSSARSRGQGEAFVADLLAAYGDPGVEDLSAFLEAHALYDVIWQASAGPDRPHAMERAAASLALLHEGRTS
jgi:Phosphotransferase enzyme family